MLGRQRQICWQAVMIGSVAGGKNGYGKEVGKLESQKRLVSQIPVERDSCYSGWVLDLAIIRYRTCLIGRTWSASRTARNRRNARQTGRRRVLKLCNRLLQRPRADLFP